MPCENKTYKDFCLGTYRSIPCCQDLDGNKIDSHLGYSNLSGETGLILQMFELGKLFVEKKMVKFHSEGTCMYPYVRPGDVLHLESRSIQEIKIGEIAVFRRFNRLLAHRVIEKGNDNGSAFIITKPDTASFGNDGSVFDKEILGIVSKVERRGRLLTTQKRDYGLFKRAGLDISLFGYYSKRYLCQKIVYLITLIQQLPVYCLIARQVLYKNKTNISFSSRLPLNNDITKHFEATVTPEELIQMNSSFDGSRMLRWDLVMKVDAKQAASISLVYRPKDCFFPGWWVSDFCLKIKYRRTHIQERLIKQLDEILTGLKIPCVFASVYENALVEYMIYRNFGFKEADALIDNSLRYKNNKEIRRIIMKRNTQRGGMRD
jgi:signal peptidase I